MKALILAAGLGTRFKSQKPKVMHPILGKPMVWYVVKTLKDAGIRDIGMVVGYCKEQVMEYFKDEGLRFFEQKNPKGGTADAVLSAIDFWRADDGQLLVINGDAPMVKAETIRQMIRFMHMVEEYEGVKLACTLLSAFLPDPTGYGRVVKDQEGYVMKIVEEKDATFEEKKINEINGGVYIFDCAKLLETIFQVKHSPVSGELYLTQVIDLMYQKGYKIRSFMAEEPVEAMGVNDRWELAIAENVLRLRILQRLAKEGNTIHQPETVYIEPDVILEGDVEIEPSVTIKGSSRIGKGAKIGKGVYIESSQIGEGAVVEPYSVIKNSTVEGYASVGPFAYLRDGTTIKSSAQIGCFVEVKSSYIGEGVKAKHLAYIGDATIEEGANIGAGVVFANFDGKKKHKSFVGKYAFIGSNSLLIAPIKVGDYAYIAGGSVINKDVPEGDLAIARARQRLLKGKGFEKLKD